MAMVKISGGNSQTIDEEAYVCQPSHASHPRGIFYGENPLDFSFPLFLLEATLIILLVRSLHSLLRPLKQPRIVSKILVSSFLESFNVNENRVQRTIRI